MISDIASLQTDQARDSYGFEVIRVTKTIENDQKLINRAADLLWEYLKGFAKCICNFLSINLAL